MREAWDRAQKTLCRDGAGVSDVPDAAERADLVARARELVAGQGTLLFLTLFGSSLYGTRWPGHSDLDVRGIFLPREPATCREEAERQKCLHASTAPERKRNASTDTDLDLVPLERWLCVMLPRGDTGALDLLFAPSHAACTLVRHPALQEVFAHPLQFLNLASGTACRSYCLGQGNTYGLAGTRLGALCRVYHLLRETHFPAGTRVWDIAREIVAQAAAPDYCSLTEEGGLLLAGQEHMGATRIELVLERLEKPLRGHLQRMEAARRNEGVDWKALSHAVRALRQQEELLTTGRLVYPLACREELVAIKQGRLDFASVEERIVEGLIRLEALRARALAGTLRLAGLPGTQGRLSDQALWQCCQAIRKRCLETSC